MISIVVSGRLVTVGQFLVRGTAMFSEIVLDRVSGLVTTRLLPNRCRPDAALYNQLDVVQQT